MARNYKSGVSAKPLSASEKLEEIGADTIFEYVADGESLSKWCRENNFRYMTVCDWIDANPDRASNYARAREARADATFESIDDLSFKAMMSDSAVEVAGLRLAADNTKWKLARMSGRYGDKQTIDLNAVVTEMTDEQRRERLAELMLKTGKS